MQPLKRARSRSRWAPPPPSALLDLYVSSSGDHSHYSSDGEASDSDFEPAPIPTPSRTASAAFSSPSPCRSPNLRSRSRRYRYSVSRCVLSSPDCGICFAPLSDSSLLIHRHSASSISSFHLHCLSSHALCRLIPFESLDGLTELSDEDCAIVFSVLWNQGGQETEIAIVSEMEEQFTANKKQKQFSGEKEESIAKQRSESQESGRDTVKGGNSNRKATEDRDSAEHGTAINNTT